LYDAVIDQVPVHGELLIFRAAAGNGPYIETNTRSSMKLDSWANFKHHLVAAVRVWEGRLRGEGDLTEEFGLYAQTGGVPVSDVMKR
jgi:hypothetical protein